MCRRGLWRAYLFEAVFAKVLKPEDVEDSNLAQVLVRRFQQLIGAKYQPRKETRVKGLGGGVAPVNCLGGRHVAPNLLTSRDCRRCSQTLGNLDRVQPHKTRHYAQVVYANGHALVRLLVILKADIPHV